MMFAYCGCQSSGTISKQIQITEVVIKKHSMNIERTYTQ